MTQQQLYYGPDRATRPARFRLPAGSCDAHAHIYGPVARFQYGGKRAFTPPDATVDDYLAMSKVTGIDRVVFTQSSQYGTDNSALLDAVERFGPNARGIVGLLPEQITDAVIQDFDARGVRGIRVHKDGSGIGPHFEHIEGLAERITDAGWRLELTPPDMKTIVGLRPRLERLKCPVFLDHMGRPDPEHGIEDPVFVAYLAMMRDGIVWSKLSHAYYPKKQAGPPYADALPFAQAIVASNPAHCVWGSDWPHPSRPWPVPNDGEVLDLLADWIPDEATRNRVLVDNNVAVNRF